MKLRRDGILLVMLLVASGCGGSGRPKTVPVEGTVLYKQKPVEGATVIFQGEGAPRNASGITDAQGKYKLTTYEPNDGAVVGNHKITVAKLDTSAVPKQEMSAEDPGEAYNQAMQMAGRDAKMGAKDQLPILYTTMDKTPLKETVTEAGPNIFTLQLQ